MQARLAQAYRSRNLRLVHRLAVPVGNAQGEGLAELLQEWQLSHQTIYTTG
jgi:hypothetical protein